MNPEIKIESGIPIPTGYSRSGVSYPFRKMNVGDSFFVETPDEKSARAVTTRAANFSYQHPGWKFATRRVKEPKGVRVWCTAKPKPLGDASPA